MRIFRPRLAAAALAIEAIAAALVQVGFAFFAVLDCDQPFEDRPPSCLADGLSLGLWILLLGFNLLVALLWYRHERAPRRGVRVLMVWVVLVQLAVMRTLFAPGARPVGGEWVEGAAVLAGCGYIAATALLTLRGPGRRAGGYGPTRRRPGHGR